jgi:hypothetical protein
LKVVTKTVTVDDNDKVNVYMVTIIIGESDRYAAVVIQIIGIDGVDSAQVLPAMKTVNNAFSFPSNY